MLEFFRRGQVTLFPESIFLGLILPREYKLSSHVRHYQANMTTNEPKNGEFLKTRFEPENELVKYALALIKNIVVVGI